MANKTDQNLISDILQTNRKFGALVVYNYFGKNPSIQQIERVANILEARRYRKIRNEKIEKLYKQIKKLENDGDDEKAFDLLVKVEELENSKSPSQKIVIGELQAIPKSDMWWFTAFNGEKFRIAEPELDASLPEERQGMYQIFEYEFRRD